MGTLFNEILHRPLVNLLVFLYEHVTFNDFGLAIIALTIIIRLILFPLFHKATEHQRLTQRLAPTIKKIQEEHKGNREAQTKATMELYAKHNLNPLTPLLLLIIQLPILIALYGVFRGGFSQQALSGLYSFVPAPTNVNMTFLGLINLNLPNIFIVAIAAVLQFLQARFTIPQNPNPSDQEKVAKRMVFIGPALTLFILWNLPAAIALYRLTSTAFSLLQQVIVDRKLTRTMGKLEAQVTKQS